MNILQAVADQHLFGQHFRGPSWRAWRAFLAALFGLPLSSAEAEVFRACTGRARLPRAPFNESWLICGRRAGKSFVLALVAVFLACFHDNRRYLGPGERATVMIIATDRRQARVIFRYVRGLLESAALLRKMIESERSDAIDLTNSVSIEVQTASFRTTRGYTIVAALCDEIAFWSTGEDAAEPDHAILDALRPAMGTIPGAMLLCASSPYAQRGALYDAFRRWHGRDDAPVLVWRAPTRAMNATFPQATIDAAAERDPAHAAAEYGAQFRTDVQGFVAREVVEGCVTRNVFERAPISGTQYFSFCDPSGGSSDSMTLAIAHREGNRVLVDAVRERRPPFSPESVAQEFAALVASYRAGPVRGDRYGGEWPREAFRRHGIEYQCSHRDRSAIYQELLPLLNSGRADLLDHSRLIAELCQLERRTGRGRDVIDHPPGGHDDVANAVAGALVTAADQNNYVPLVGPIIIVGGVRVDGGAQPLTGEAARRATAAHVQSEIEQIHREASGYAAGSSGGGIVGYGWRRFDYPGGSW